MLYVLPRLKYEYETLEHVEFDIDKKSKAVETAGSLLIQSQFENKLHHNPCSGLMGTTIVNQPFSGRGRKGQGNAQELLVTP